MELPLLEVSNLSINYNAIRAVTEVGFGVQSGNIAVLLGPNGAGKSSILKAISGIAPISKGSINLRGIEINKWSPRHRVENGIAQVMEGRRLFGDQSVIQNLEMGAYTRFRKGRKEYYSIREDIREYLTRFPILDQRRHQLAKTLSGGEQQMLVFSMAMMARPKVLLLDEPSLGLAPLVVRELFKFIVDVKEWEIGVILVEQMAAFALRIADYAYVLDRGRIVAKGYGQELIKSAESGELKRLYFSLTRD